MGAPELWICSECEAGRHAGCDSPRCECLCRLSAELAESKAERARYGDTVTSKLARLEKIIADQADQIRKGVGEALVSPKRYRAFLHVSNGLATLRAAVRAVMDRMQTKAAQQGENRDDDPTFGQNFDDAYDAGRTAGEVSVAKEVANHLTLALGDST